MAVEFSTVDLKMGAEAGQAPPEYELHPSSPPRYTQDAPPSYESVFGRVRQMRDESSGNKEFAKKLVGVVVCGTVCNVISICIMLAIPMACMVFGALYLGDCPREPYIPKYLIVAGVFGFIKAVINIAQQVIKQKISRGDSGEDPNQNGAVKGLSMIDGPISCFILSWFVSGSVWTYRIHEDYTDIIGDPDYCNPTLYMFTFWVLTVQYIMLCLCLLCCCVGFIVVCCVAGKQRS